MRNATLPLLLISALIAAPSCIFSPETTDPPEKPKVVWPDLTNRDDVAKTIVLCYENPQNNESETRYEGVLHSEYFFAYDPDDVEPGGDQIMTLSDDILSTKWLFANHVDLYLEINPADGGTWEQITELDGKPCENCWQGRRDYQVRFQQTDESISYQSTPGSAAVTIIVAPNESDPSKWVLRAIYDEYNN
jgi:hypothetical protein